MEMVGSEHASSDDRNAHEWIPHIRRGALGKAASRGASQSEYIVYEAAGTVLPSGEPVLALLTRITPADLSDIRRALELVGVDVWRHELQRRKAQQGQHSDATSHERQMVLSLLDGTFSPASLCGSTSEVITALLAVGRYEELPRPYQKTEDAWDRLNAVQREIVREFNPTFRSQTWNRPVRYS